MHVSGHGHAEELRTMLGLVRPRRDAADEFRMLAAHGRLAQEAGRRRSSSCWRTAPSSSLKDGPRIVDQIESGVTFVDGLGVGDVKDVALRDRRTLSEDGVLIIVATIAGSNGAAAAMPELIARGLTEPGPLLEEMRAEADRVLRDLLGQNVREIKLLQEHHDAVGQLIYDRTGRRP